MAITAEQLPDGTFRFHGRANDITIQKNKALEPFGKQVLNYGQVLRLLPTPEQAQDLNQQIGNARRGTGRWTAIWKSGSVCIRKRNSPLELKHLKKNTFQN